MKQFNTIIILFLILVLNSCRTPAEFRARKLMNAKNKIDRLVLKFPELKVTKDTTYYLSDTTIINRTKYINDSVFIAGGTTIDTILQLGSIDSVFTIFAKNIELKLLKLANNNIKATVSVVPHYIYEVDTLYSKDTIFRDKIIIKNTEIINTEKSFWWSLWFTLKGWLWYILIILGIIILVMIILRVIKSYFKPL